jgi:DnaJ-class molecular chaperone
MTKTLEIVERLREGFTVEAGDRKIRIRLPKEATIIQAQHEALEHTEKNCQRCHGSGEDFTYRNPRPCPACAPAHKALALTRGDSK